MQTSELIEIFVKKAKIYDLEQLRYNGMPAYHPVSPAFLYFLYRHHENYYRPEREGPRTSSSGLIIMTDQSGTHIDARCHQASDLTLPGGVKITPDVETPWGFEKLGAEHIPPIIGRGILIDAAYKKDPLPEEYEITLDEFKEAMRSEGVEIKENDIVLVRTGYGKYWNDPEKYTKAAGISKEVSVWLGERNVLAVGSDNLAWDVPKYRDPETKSALPAHLYLLARKGIYIMENLYLEELARDKVYSFLFIGLPLKMKGATGSPLRPIAVILP
jgi:kynurenine formamidase